MKIKQIIPSLFLILSGCGQLAPQTSSDDSDADKTTDPVEVGEDGSGSSSFSDAAGEVAIESGTLAGTQLAIEAGTFSEATEVSFAEGANMADEELVSELGLGEATLESAGPSVLLTADKDVDATQPMTLSIPVAGASLALADKNLVVVYRVRKASDGLFYVGVIHDGVLVDGVIQVKATYFGSYQAVYSSVAITKKVEAPSFKGLQPKVAASKYDGEWVGECKFENDPNKDPRYKRETRRVSGKSFVIIDQVFADTPPNCTGPKLQKAVIALDIIKLAPSSVVAGADEVDLEIRGEYLVLQNQQYVDHSNSDANCGITGWQIGVPKPVDFSKCGDPDSDDKGPPLGLKLFTIAKIDGEHFRTGASENESGLDESAPDKRPVTLETENYKKVK
jgi:hypothetical protein